MKPILNNEFAQVYHDKNVSMVVALWKRHASNNECHQIINAIRDAFVYQSAKTLLIDSTYHGQLAPNVCQDLQDAISEATQLGLSRVIFIDSEGSNIGIDKKCSTNYNLMKEGLSLEIDFASSLTNARHSSANVNIENH